MQYYIRFRGKAFGPFGEKQLLLMKAQRKLSRTSEVSEDKIVWQSASELNFLFPEPLPEPVQQTTETPDSTTLESVTVSSDTVSMVSPVPVKMLSIVNLVCQDSMKEYDKWAKIAINAGDSASDGINYISDKIEERMKTIQYLFLDDVEKELKKIQSDSHLSKEFRVKLAEFYVNCIEIKSYVDKPRGTVESYKQKLIELSDTGDRLRRQLQLLSGIKETDE
ncbi:MAG: hypothetical protein LBQ50_04970 [Planctomycetaceae bacterium]|jgi:hypothetical protein|nr:hypothetical protein [Planctomycetaceae bacterium]